MVADRHVRWSVGAMVFAFLLLALQPAPAQEKGKTPKEALDQVQGTWVLVKQQEGGKEAPVSKGKQLLTFVGKRCEMGTKKEISIAWTVTVSDAKSDPVKADTVVVAPEGEKGRPSLWIWRVEDDTLHIAFGYNGEARPTDFPAKEGSKWSYNVYKRAKK